MNNASRKGISSRNVLKSKRFGVFLDCLMFVHLSAAVWLLQSLKRKQEMLSRTIPVTTVNSMTWI